MTCTDEGIVISSIKYSESSQIVRFFCAREGLISAMVRSTCKKKGISKAYLSPFYLLELVFTRSTRSDLITLKEVSGGIGNIRLSDSIHKQAMCLFGGELLRNVLEPGYSNAELFHFLKHKQQELLDMEQPGSAWSVLLVLGIIQNLGFGIESQLEKDAHFNVQEGTFSPQHQLSSPYTLDSTLSGALAGIIDGHEAPKDKSLNARLLNALLDFLVFHIHGFKKPRSLEVLREVYL
jgi:DNA repair protein RecO (recombination protein O)